MKRWHYKNLTLTFLSIILSVIVFRDERLHAFLLHLGNLEYFGAFLAGAMFVSTFTITTGAIVLLIIAQQLSPVEIGIIAGMGAVVGDFIFLKFVKSNLMDEIEEVYDKIDFRHHIQKIFHTKYFSWSLPVIGALIIASPLPDEMGVTLLGISKLKTYQFLLISFVLNATGIFLVVSASSIIKP